MTAEANREDKPKTATLRVVVRGTVQGVNYRRWLQGEARRREVSGWVRNLSDGAVEAVLHGEAQAVGAVVEACRRGPPPARVEKLESSAASYDGTPGFRIEDTV